VLSDGLACFAAVTEAGCQHHAIIIVGRKPKDLPEFLWLNTVLGNLTVMKMLSSPRKMKDTARRGRSNF